MFNLLRTFRNEKQVNPQTCYVSWFSETVLASHWFTATPNPSESVFKPFVFTHNVRISPLTKLPESGEVTLLQKLHSQRNWAKVGDLLRSLEATCVDEVKRVLSETKLPNSEFDELLKDCVEAEVKFYR